ncbi:MAG: bifunctional diaminohydroxyphosphoribosylaminopyrimidine deaminase/5-amino-6-(5-phosphoribosylamino)uracil reductase RibD [Paracoccaceae bacterium]|nr:bifunctional diaminohydroxyphosphoribosylaminopyrimidine deaminase/5-amino-6-(5-phosphoribosylamino)uracil reductase RibD [Paracoccaceae bacterium]
MTDDLRWMRLALALGERGMGRVWPNPAVGCVIVKGARVLGRGWTRDGGRPHAETVALAQAGAAARSATAYVSLEPCAHHGATPPCAEALVEAGVARVVTALEDPDPRVAGKGHAMLRAAGIEVATGVLEAEARRAQAGFLSRVTRGRPMLTLKLAASLDGRIAAASGESRWITGPEARRLVHAMRARHDAVLIGAGTARADDPELTVRGLGIARKPVRLVASRRLELSPEGRLGSTAPEVPVWLLHGPEAGLAHRAAWEATGARLIEVPGGEGAGLDAAEMLAALGREGLTRIFCEGGGTLAAALLGAGLVDRLALFTGGLALGAEARPGLGGLGLSALYEAPRFRLREARAVGPDALQLWDAE